MSLVQFCSPFTSSGLNEENAINWFPVLDVTEEKNQYIVDVEVPGVKKEDVKVLFDNGVLTIEGERKSNAETNERNYHRIERSYGKFLRHLKLGTDVDVQGIKASYKDGVLSVVVPKVEKAKPLAIDIAVN
jgi:HSP20 family protein